MLYKYFHKKLLELRAGHNVETDVGHKSRSKFLDPWENREYLKEGWINSRLFVVNREAPGGTKVAIYIKPPIEHISENQEVLNNKTRVYYRRIYDDDVERGRKYIREEEGWEYTGQWVEEIEKHIRGNKNREIHLQKIEHYREELREELRELEKEKDLRDWAQEVYKE